MQGRRKKWWTIEPPSHFFLGGDDFPRPLRFCYENVEAKPSPSKSLGLLLAPPPRIFGPSYGPALHLVVRSFSYYTVL